MNKIFANYILLDAARMNGEFVKATSINSINVALLNDKGEECLKTVSPYLFDVKRNEKFVEWFFREGWGQSWGVLVDSEKQLTDLQSYFRKLFLFKTGQGVEIYFRFYDPRVLRDYLFACDPVKLAKLYSFVNKFICEDEDAAFILIFSFNGSKLLFERKEVKSFF